MLASYSAVVLAAFAALLSAVPTSAHMVMSDPAPFRYKGNPNVDPGNVDSDMVAPLKTDGSNFPCKGYHSDFGTPAGAPTATWAAGSSQSMTMSGGAVHNGGSCQLALSFDGGNTWEVIKSVHGSCPTADGDKIDFEVPSDVAAGTAIFAWTWFNNTGVREMYMNCAAVEITGGAAKRDLSKRAARPALFAANVGNGCSTADNLDVQFPDPGAAVEERSGAKLAAPIGTCGAAAPPGRQEVETPPTNESSAAPVVPDATGVAPPTTPPTDVTAPKQCKRWRKKAL